jgi:hypothetical protein
MIDSDVLADWRPLFLMVAGASASLTGLLFVALSLHSREIASQPLYRYRARLCVGSRAGTPTWSARFSVMTQQSSGKGRVRLHPDS